MELATSSATHDALIDPKPKLYTTPDADEPPGFDTSHGMMLEMIGTDKRVVEFGCATGYMSRWLVAARCRVTGVEVDAAMASEARGVCDEVVVADLDTRRLVDLLPGAAFDIAVFGDVLEHLRDPWRVLDETRSLLAEGGAVVISIPNVAHGNVRLALLHGAFDYQKIGLMDNTHLRFFTLKTVRELCLRAGYEIERIDRTKAALFAPIDLMPRLDPNDFDPKLVAEIQRDPEHDTFQFIIRAVPLSDEQRLDALLALQSQLSGRLNGALAEIGKLEARLAEVRERAEIQVEQELLLVERSMVADRETKENERLREDVADSKREIERLEQGVEASRVETERKCQRLELELDAERLKAQDAEEALRETVTLFLEHANSELDSVRSEITQLNRAIGKVQRSFFWSLKLQLLKLRQLL